MIEPTQIRERLERPKRASELQAAREHESRVRFHSETMLDKRSLGRALSSYYAWVRRLIPADKAAIFETIAERMPFPSVTLTDDAYKALEKVFDGRNGAELYEFTEPQTAEDWEAYRANVINSPWVWREEGFEVMKTAINSLVVVDLPTEAGPGLSEPYFYFLDLDAVIDFEPDGDDLKWVIFRQDADRIAVVDDTSWRVFRTENYRELKELERESPHGLGYCPARFYWTTPVTRTNRTVKRSPITNTLGDLDWFLFFALSKRHLDLYAPYPIYSGFSADCDYELDNSEINVHEHCEGGFLRDREGRYLIRAGVLAECPACTKKRIAGVGSFVEVPTPSPENNNADLRNPVQITTVDRASLDYNVEEVDRMKGHFLESVTGFAGERITAEAVNEKQVKAFFENRTNVLRSLKKDLETIQEWTETTVCRLRYGAAFVSCAIDYGSEFYLLTADDLLDIYLAAREKGADAVTLDLLHDQYLETRFRNNMGDLARARMIVDIEPMRHISKADAAGLLAAGIITPAEYAVKMNFSSLLSRFERENADITRFDVAANYDVRVARVQEVISSYINTNRDETERPGESQSE